MATSVTFGEAWDIPVADLEAAQRCGWQLARPDAYPEVFHNYVSNLAAVFPARRSVARAAATAAAVSSA